MVKKTRITAIIIGVVLFCGILVFAISGPDNTKQYDSETKTITIVDKHNDSFATIQLITDIEYSRFPGPEEKKVAEAVIISEKKYKKVFKKIDFFNNKNNQQIDRDFTYKYKVKIGEKEVVRRVQVCNPYPSGIVNSSGVHLHTNCTYQPAGSFLEPIFEWRNLEDAKKKELQQGNITIGIFTVVQPGDNIEWIPTWFDVEILEFASWVDSFDVGHVAYYTFEETSGILTRDESLNHNGNITNDVGLGNAGILSKSFHYNGTDGYVAVGINVSDFNVTHRTSNLGNITISAWVKQNTSNLGGVVTQTIGGEPSFAIRLGGAGGRNVRAELGGSFADSIDAFEVNGPFQHVVMSTNGSHLQLFINGSRVSSTSYNGNVPTNSRPIAIGRQQEGGLVLHGAIDEVSFWNRSLTDSEIADLYNEGAGLHHGNYNLNILFPANTTYGSSDLPFIFNITANLNGTMNYSLNGGGSNVTMGNITGGVVGKNFTASNDSLADGDYLFEAFFTAEKNGFANNIQSVAFFFDATAPDVNISSVQTVVDSKLIEFDSNASDLALDVCWFSIYNSVGVVDGANNNLTFTCNLNASALVSDFATFDLVVYANDTFGNLNFTNFTFTTSSSGGPGPSGGGGGVGSIIEKIFPELEESICLPFEENYRSALAEVRVVGFDIGLGQLGKFINALLDFVFCKGAASIVPI